MNVLEKLIKYKISYKGNLKHIIKLKNEDIHANRVINSKLESINSKVAKSKSKFFISSNQIIKAINTGDDKYAVNLIDNIRNSPLTNIKLKAATDTSESHKKSKYQSNKSIAEIDDQLPYKDNSFGLNMINKPQCSSFFQSKQNRQIQVKIKQSKMQDYDPEVCKFIAIISKLFWSWLSEP